MENFREPGEMSSGDERAEKKRKSHKKEKKDKKRDQDADGGEEQEEKRRHKKEHRHKKSKKSKSEKRDKSPAVDDDESAERKSSRIKSTEHVPGDATLGAHNSPTTTDIAGKESSSSSVGKTATATIAPFVEPMDLNSGQRVEEMSIEETNKVRAKLGLKPLQIDGAKNADGSLVTPKKQEDVHAPPINMADAKKAQLLKEKLETRKEKRQIQKKLSKVKPLAAGSDDEESAEAWAERTRREARLKAAERERLQAEQDAEEEKEEVRRQPSYTMNDLKGLRVEHDMEKFQEGRDVILTLKDSGVLDEDAGDVLVSTALNEEERLKKNIENRKKKAAYNPYENADNLDEFGTPVEPQLLKKYDETIGGEQKKAFVIGAGGSSSAAAAFRQQPMVNLKNLHDLMATPQTLAREYYTEDEMSAKFKKVRKIKKKGGGETGGSQIRSRIIDDEDAAPSFPTSSNQILDEEDDTELQLALSRSRRIKQEESFKPVIKREEDDDVEMEPSQSPASKPSASSSRGVVYLDETSEFCRAVGSSASTSRAAVREEVIVQPEYEDDAVDMDVDMDRDDDGHLLMKQDAKGGWSEVQFEAEPANLGSDEEDGGGGRRGGRKQAMATTRIDSHGRRVLIKSVMDDEPTCERGVGAALNLIVKKGLLANENASRHPTVFNDGKPSSIPAQTYVIDDKVIDDDKRGRQDRYMGPTTTFKEKAGYQPTFVLAYHDTAGHAMNQKEAFRDLSHKFHGKGPGKMKTERRAKKYLEEKLMLEMSSTDTPLHTVQKMQQKQQELQTPYIVLSGAASAKGPTPISKKSNY